MGEDGGGSRSPETEVLHTDPSFRLLCRRDVGMHVVQICIHTKSTWLTSESRTLALKLGRSNVNSCSTSQLNCMRSMVLTQLSDVRLTD